MADPDPIQPIHQPVLPVFDEEETWVEHAAERFEDARAEEPRLGARPVPSALAISAAGGVDGMVLVDMAWRLNPDVRVFTLDTGRLRRRRTSCSNACATATGSPWSSSTPRRTPWRGW